MGKRLIIKGADFSNCTVDTESINVDVPVSFSWEYDGKYILKSDGTLTSLSTWKTSELINVPQGAIAVKGVIYGYPTVANVACYNSSGTYLGGFNIEPAHLKSEYYVSASDFPAGTTKIRVCSDIIDNGMTPEQVTVIFEVADLNLN